MTPERAQRIAAAVIYAMRCGLFFPVPEPEPAAPLGEWLRWGALRHLHDVVAESGR